MNRPLMAQVREENVVLIPFMAQGHLIPFLALAIRIEQRFGYTVTLVNTPLNIQKLHSSLPSNTSIRLVELPFSSSDHDLPPDSENTDVLPYPLIFHLFQASLSLKPSFTRLISHLSTNQQRGCRRPPLCIISDMFFGWTAEIAREFGIFHSVFIAGGAYGMGVFFSLWLNQPQLKTDSIEFSLPDFPQISRIHRSQLSNAAANATGTDFQSVFLQTQFSLSLKSDGLLMNTIEEIDHISLDYFRRKMGAARPVWSIGPVTPVNYSLNYKARNCSGNTKEAYGISCLDRCIEWLDKHQPDSVLYVSFGSQNAISISQLMELAIGLEQSGKYFIWVIRPPIGFDINGEFRSEWLPEGFEERMKEQNRGLLVRKWAPQLEILSHKSTSVFLSHCGWNSVLESLSHGVPIIGWPLSADQFYNTKMLEEEMGVCIEMGRGNSDAGCMIKHEEVVRVIDLVMNKKTVKGEEMKKKARQIEEKIKGAIKEDDEGFKGSSLKAMDEFFNMALLTGTGRKDHQVN